MKKFAYTFALFALFPLLAFGFDVPELDYASLFSAVVALVVNVKTWGFILSGMALIVILMNVLNKFVPAFPLKPVIVVVLAVAYGVFQYVSQGQGVFEALFQTLVSGRGAMMIYDAIRAYADAKNAGSLVQLKN